MSNTDISKLALQTQSVYQRNARRFASKRPKTLVEQLWLDRFIKLVPKHGSILDLGCGAGDPIGSYFIKQGHRVVGLDASSNMIEMAREINPHGDWRHGDMRHLDLPERFHGIIGWNSFFHLTRDEQRKALPEIARHLHPEGALLLTVGPNEGEVTGCVGDDPIYHASLSPNEYGDILASHGIRIRQFVPEDPDCYGMTILLAQKAVFLEAENSRVEISDSPHLK
ncbi:SAM-dependent methyltransferase [Sedimentitalea sp. CY04]|uniref:SAM-dependent methyltransferase n=1 Tax=Parasedimentitalea denitrificans TaxID=2211118 RepID=A0ABX0W6H4_9RHOB|nr:class I SAM-dependent methyltransferase [Sedimentitalea sp. CY04]NIZ61239.1 SAM-dependent methyltransferase [Sedimentitalea sp. CY04]